MKSAYAYLIKHSCLDPEKQDIAKAFFVKKIPTVITAELTKELNSVLGLNLEIN